MEQKTIITTIVGILVVAGGAWAASVYWQDTPAPEPEPAEQEQVEDEAGERDERFAYIERIDAVHFYEDGTHTFVGEIDMPTPCDLLEFGAVVMESFPEQIRLEFEVVNEDAEMCAQVITPQRFMIEATASEEATVSAQFMGSAIELNLRDPQPGETPDDFELFIKG